MINNLPENRGNHLEKTEPDKISFYLYAFYRIFFHIISFVPYIRIYAVRNNTIYKRIILIHLLNRLLKIIFIRHICYSRIPSVFVEYNRHWKDCLIVFLLKSLICTLIYFKRRIVISAEYSRSSKHCIYGKWSAVRIERKAVIFFLEIRVLFKKYRYKLGKTSVLHKNDYIFSCFWKMKYRFNVVFNFRRIHSWIGRLNAGRVFYCNCRKCNQQDCWNRLHNTNIFVHQQNNKYNQGCYTGSIKQQFCQWNWKFLRLHKNQVRCNRTVVTWKSKAVKNGDKSCTCKQQSYSLSCFPRK